jgi:hypothetical protein
MLLTLKSKRVIDVQNAKIEVEINQKPINCKSMQTFTGGTCSDLSPFLMPEGTEVLRGQRSYTLTFQANLDPFYDSLRSELVEEAFFVDGIEFRLTDHQGTTCIAEGL